MIADLRNRFDPQADVLLRAVSAHMSDEMLEWISTADCGNRADEHLIALRRVRDTGTFPKELKVVPLNCAR